MNSGVWGSGICKRARFTRKSSNTANASGVWDNIYSDIRIFGYSDILRLQQIFEPLFFPFFCLFVGEELFNY